MKQISNGLIQLFSSLFDAFHLTTQDYFQILKSDMNEIWFDLWSNPNPFQQFDGNTQVTNDNVERVLKSFCFMAHIVAKGDSQFSVMPVCLHFVFIEKIVS